MAIIHHNGAGQYSKKRSDEKEVRIPEAILSRRNLW